VRETEGLALAVRVLTALLEVEGQRVEEREPMAVPGEVRDAGTVWLGWGLLVGLRVRAGEAEVEGLPLEVSVAPLRCEAVASSRGVAVAARAVPVERPSGECEERDEMLRTALALEVREVVVVEELCREDEAADEAVAVGEAARSPEAVDCALELALAKEDSEGCRDGVCCGLPVEHGLPLAAALAVTASSAVVAVACSAGEGVAAELGEAELPARLPEANCEALVLGVPVPPPPSLLAVPCGGVGVRVFPSASKLAEDSPEGVEMALKEACGKALPVSSGEAELRSDAEKALLPVIRLLPCPLSVAKGESEGLREVVGEGVVLRTAASEPLAAALVVKTEASVGQGEEVEAELPVAAEAEPVSVASRAGEGVGTAAVPLGAPSVAVALMVAGKREAVGESVGVGVPVAAAVGEAPD
jgi:hypothetical protein